MNLFLVPLYLEVCGGSYCAYKESDTQAKHTTGFKVKSADPSPETRDAWWH